MVKHCQLRKVSPSRSSLIDSLLLGEFFLSLCFGDVDGVLSCPVVKERGKCRRHINYTGLLECMNGCELVWAIYYWSDHGFPETHQRAVEKAGFEVHRKLLLYKEASGRRGAIIALICSGEDFKKRKSVV